jgi:hypothetical protein
MGNVAAVIAYVRGGGPPRNAAATTTTANTVGAPADALAAAGATLFALLKKKHAEAIAAGADADLFLAGVTLGVTGGRCLEEHLLGARLETGDLVPDQPPHVDALICCDDKCTYKSLSARARGVAPIHWSWLAACRVSKEIVDPTPYLVALPRDDPPLSDCDVILLRQPMALEAVVENAGGRLLQADAVKDALAEGADPERFLCIIGRREHSTAEDLKALGVAVVTTRELVEALWRWTATGQPSLFQRQLEDDVQRRINAAVEAEQEKHQAEIAALRQQLEQTKKAEFASLLATRVEKLEATSEEKLARLLGEQKEKFELQMAAALAQQRENLEARAQRGLALVIEDDTPGRIR